MRWGRSITTLRVAARVIRIAGWVLAGLYVIIGEVIAASHERFGDFVIRVLFTFSLLAITQVAAWLCDRQADRIARRERLSKPT